MRKKYTRKFGVEFEFLCEWKILKKYASKVIKEVYGPRSYYAKEDSFDSDFRLNQWHIKEENINISELTTPLSQHKDVERICKVIDYLRESDIKVDDNCGLHVHIDIHDIDKYHLMGAWLWCERSIMKCFPVERRKSGFCECMIEKPLNKRLIAKILEEKTDESEHMKDVNLGNYDNRKTVEIRLSEGSLDTTWIRAWIKFLLRWVDFAKSNNPSLLPSHKCNSIDFYELLEEMELDRTTNEIITNRYKKFNRKPYWKY